VLWALIFERLYYLLVVHPKAVNSAISTWQTRPDHSSWRAHMIREQIISMVSQKLEQNLQLIKSLVALCPLMGLLGTVTGMIDVFDVMAISGSGNARSMAAGVSKATIPTMAGMVVALSGMFLSIYLQRQALRERELLGEHLQPHD
jgi:biopolymer transport protein ExbB